MATNEITVRAAHARVASLNRWHPADADAIREARQALARAKAAALLDRAADLLAGSRP
ncbi:hypothetical protein GCM10027517_03230 [Phycicoccus ginsengisoli]